MDTKSDEQFLIIQAANKANKKKMKANNKYSDEKRLISQKTSKK